MDVVSTIEQIIVPSINALGYSLVQLKLLDGKSKTLSIMAERADDVMMSFDDCEAITNAVSALLDVEEPISGAYSLEVCSPGLDRPLVKREDYTRFAGSEVRAETIITVGGRKRFKGVLQGIDGDNIKIQMPEGAVELPFSYIRTAKLVPSDEIVRKDLKKAKKEPKIN
jgi:ribosome maturation factor RimP